MFPFKIHGTKFPLFRLAFSLNPFSLARARWEVTQADPSILRQNESLPLHFLGLELQAKITFLYSWLGF